MLATILAAAVGAGAAPAASPADGDWPRATPESRGLDGPRLERLAARIEAGRDYPDLHSLLIVRHGDLVFERYFDGWNADRLHTLQSVTKSFTSALVGIAIERGAIESVDQRVLDFFESSEGIAHLDERKRRLRLEDLLTMRSGTDYHERGAGSPHSQLNALASGWDRFYLDRPMVTHPGSTFLYDSGGVILMSSLIHARTGLHADGYAQQHLFAPLGITRTRWYSNRDGHPHTGGGLDLRPRDMAKFGQLYLQRGRWGDRQIVPSEWVERSTRLHVELPRQGHNVGYGYLWWIHEPDPDGAGEQHIYAAQGFRGQYIFVVPEHDLVVVVTGGTQNRTDQRKPISMLYEQVLPSLNRDE